MNRFRFLVLAVLLALSTLAPSALADGMTLTGTALRVKTIGFVDFKVYIVNHFMKDKPAQKSKAAVIEADTDKQFVWYMQNTVATDKIKDKMRDTFKMNGFTDGAKIEQFVGAFGGGDLDEWKKGQPASVVITYNAANKTTSINVTGKGSASIAGPEFMKAVWSLWFGKNDQESMGKDLISKL